MLPTMSCEGITSALANLELTAAASAVGKYHGVDVVSVRVEALRWLDLTRFGGLLERHRAEEPGADRRAGTAFRPAVPARRRRAGRAVPRPTGYDA